MANNCTRFSNSNNERTQLIMKLIYQNRGLHWALGIEGTPSEIELQHTSLFNHGGIDKGGDLQWMGDNFAYVWTTQERLKKYFKNASYHEILNNIETVGAWPSEGLRFGAMVSRMIRERAEERYNQMINENFLRVCERFSVPFEMGTLDSSK